MTERNSPPLQNNAFKKGDEWRLTDMSDIIATIADPKEEKVSGKRSIFYFDEF